ncbi:hypothetical protein [Oricola sp.]|uniref:hypothetical protein n=1 Tax=Oricola sp. TaxID=1979950 RepID=UPI003517BE6E
MMINGAVVRSVAGNLAIVLAFAAVFAQLFGFAVPWPVWAAVFALHFLVHFDRLKRNARIILSIGIALFAGGWLLAGEAPGNGFERAGFLFVFLLVMQYLADLAARSPEIGRAAETIVTRPPGQRYLFVTLGSHVLALFLQIGAVILIMTLLMSRLKDANEAMVRSLTVAQTRGFTGTALWSPLSLGILIVFSHVPNVSYIGFVPGGLAGAAFFLAVGYWMERGRRAKVPGVAAISTAEKWTLARVVALAALLVVSGLAWVGIFDVPLIEGMFTVVLILGILWSAVSISGGRMSFGQGAASLSNAGSSLVNEIGIIAGATVIGGVGEVLLEHWGGLQGAVSLEMASILALAIPWAIFAFGMIAMNPVLSVTILSGALNAIWPDAAKFWLICALTWGWAIASGGTPFTANMLITAQKVGREAPTVALAWNGRFSLLMLACFSVAAALGTFFWS